MPSPSRPWAWRLLRMGALLALVLVVIDGLVRQPVWLLRPPSPVQVAPQSLEAHVRFLSVDCHPRHSLARENQAKAIAYITTHLREAGGRMVRQEFTTPSGNYENVIAHFGPEAGPRYVIGAHFDSCGVQPGADDNASGVAALLELAVLLGREKSLPAHFELVAYNLEEPPNFASPHMGSAIHARSLKEKNIPVALMLSLEMVGYFKDERGSQAYPVALMKLLYPSRGNFIAVVGRWDQRRTVGAFKRACAGTADIPIVSLAAPSSLPAIDFSDHRNYWAEGYPALMITDTSFFRNPNYHQPTDTYDTLDYRRMAEVVRMLHAGLLDVAKL